MGLKNNFLLLEEGLRLFLRSKKKRFFKTKRYYGSSKHICRAIISDCFHNKKKYFRVSPNNFNQFYARDFGMFCEALLNLGYRAQVISTIDYAMSKYVLFNRVSTQISPRGVLVDFPCWSPESVSFMLNAVVLVNDKKLIQKYKSFFEAQARFIYEEVLDKKTGLVRKDKSFSSMKDYANQKSSCYVNCLVGLFAENLKKIGVVCELHNYNWSELIIKHFWKENHFIDDLSGKRIISGDANVFPFWTGLVKDKRVFKKAFMKIKDKKLDVPFALKYNSGEDDVSWNFFHYLNKNYEHNSVWLHLGMCYLKVLDLFGEHQELLSQLKIHKKLIETQKSFFEVYDSNGRPFRSLVFEYDEAMIWCSQFLDLENKHL